MKLNILLSLKPKSVTQLIVLVLGICSFQQVLSAQDPLVVESEATRASCDGATDGQIELSISGGQGPFEISWVDSGGNELIETGLGEGVHTYSVMDLSSGEIVVGQDIIYVYNSLDVYFTSFKNPSYCGACDGTATITVEGGSAPYDISWPDDAIVSADRLSATGLCSGSVSVFVNDVNPCWTLEELNLVCVEEENLPTIPDPMDISIDFFEPGCGCSNGWISVGVTGGVGPFEITWPENGYSGFKLERVPADTYVFGLFDLGSGEVVFYQHAFFNPETLIAYFTSASYSSLCGFCDGGATLEIVGGTPPFDYSWPEGAIVSEDGLSATGLCEGMINLMVFDTRGCASGAAVRIECGEPMEHSVSQQNSSCLNSADGAISVSISNGQAPFSYEWSNGMTGPSITNVLPGNYTVTVTDYNGHTAVISVDLISIDDCLEEVNNDLSDFASFSFDSNISVIYDNSRVWLVRKQSANGNKQAYNVYATSGALIQSGWLQEQSALLNANELKSGIYIVQSGSNSVRFIIP